MTSETTWTDPREQIEAVVMMANGRLAPRTFADRAEAEAWAHPELGDRVPERNLSAPATARPLCPRRVTRRCSRPPMPVVTRRGVLHAPLTLDVPAVVLLAMAVPASLVAQRAEGWSGLGLIMLGLAAAIALGVVALLVTAAVAFGRALPRGQRWRPALAAVVGPLAALIVTTPSRVGRAVAQAVPGQPDRAAAARGDGPRALEVGRDRRRRGGGARVRRRRGQAVGTRPGPSVELARFEGALPLTDGRSLDSPLPGGWVHLVTDVPYPGMDLPLRMQWRRGAGTPDEGNYSVEVDTDRTDCTPFADEPACTVVGQGVHGEVTRHYSGYVFVRVGDVEWRVESDGLDDADATVVLDSLEPVDVDTSCGSPRARSTSSSPSRARRSA